MKGIVNSERGIKLSSRRRIKKGMHETRQTRDHSLSIKRQRPNEEPLKGHILNTKPVQYYIPDGDCQEHKYLMRSLHKEILPEG